MTDEIVDTPQDAATEKSAGYALLIELDYVLLAGLPEVFAACKSALAGAGIELDEVLFGRFLLDRPVELGLAALVKFLGKKDVALDGVAEKISGALPAAVAAGRVSPREEVVACIKALLADADWRVGCVTSLSADAAALCLERLRLVSDDLVVVADAPSVVGGFTVEAWSRLSQRVELRPHMMMAVASSAGSCQAALGAGTNVTAIMDPLTEFQDYSGADLVLNSVTEIGAAVELLKRR